MNGCQPTPVALRKPLFRGAAVLSAEAAQPPSASPDFTAQYAGYFPAWDQIDSGFCVAFMAAAGGNSLQVRQGVANPVLLSPPHPYWEYGEYRGIHDNEGAYIPLLLERAGITGICAESQMPLSTLHQFEFWNVAPSAAAKADGLLRKLSSYVISYDAATLDVNVLKWALIAGPVGYGYGRHSRVLFSYNDGYVTGWDSRGVGQFTSTFADLKAEGFDFCALTSITLAPAPSNPPSGGISMTVQNIRNMAATLVEPTPKADKDAIIAECNKLQEVVPPSDPNITYMPPATSFKTAAGIPVELGNKVSDRFGWELTIGGRFGLTTTPKAALRAGKLIKQSPDNGPWAEFNDNPWAPAWTVTTAP